MHIDAAFAVIVENKLRRLFMTTGKDPSISASLDRCRAIAAHDTEQALTMMALAAEVAGTRIWAPTADFGLRELQRRMDVRTFSQAFKHPDLMGVRALSHKYLPLGTVVVVAGVDPIGTYGPIEGYKITCDPKRIGVAHIGGDNDVLDNSSWLGRFGHGYTDH